MAIENHTVDPRPDWLQGIQAEGTQPGVIEVDGKQYIFTIISKETIPPEIPYAAGFPDDTALMISENVPEEDREFILAHEIREKKNEEIAGLAEERRCQAALQREIAEVRTKAPERLTAYVDRRRNLFDALVKYYEKPEQAAAVTPKFIEGLHASRVYLHLIAPPAPSNPANNKYALAA